MAAAGIWKSEFPLSAFIFLLEIKGSELVDEVEGGKAPIFAPLYCFDHRTVIC